MALPAFAAERRAAAQLLLGARRPPLAIDISCSHDAQQQTRRTPLLRSNDGTVDGRIDGQTDRRTDTYQTASRPVQLLRLPTIPCFMSNSTRNYAGDISTSLPNTVVWNRLRTDPSRPEIPMLHPAYLPTASLGLISLMNERCSWQDRKRPAHQVHSQWSPLNRSIWNESVPKIITSDALKVFFP